MSKQGFFKGTAVVIDDELNVEHSAIVKIVRDIKTDGGYVIGLDALPEQGSDLTNLGGAAFFVLDWQLHGSELEATPFGGTVSLPPALEKQYLDEKIQFLKNLRKTRLAPVFIFTSSDLNVVETALREHPELYPEDSPSHIFVMSKAEVISRGVFTVLNEWVNGVPSLLALKTWEMEYERAKNALFTEFYNKSVYWPALLWQTFADDGVPPSDELGRLISRNLFSRMTPFHMDMGSFLTDVEDQRKKNPDDYRKTLLQVLEGERFVRVEGLHDDSIAPGDVFIEGKKYWLNIRPDCDCISRNGEAIELYLLKGERVTGKAMKDGLDVKRGSFSERDDEAIVFAMLDGHSVSFKFKKIYQRKWDDIKVKRKGRLLSPFLTRIQQRYASYLQRPGLPKIPRSAMPTELIAAAEAIEEDAEMSNHVGESCAVPLHTGNNGGQISSAGQN
ncbi:hypothetical protein [Burkholderia ubonensis]|uniref:hypothetical protein n=1 Tax=Burkholderia ubonensis TaxID=101571 RepID=UPI000ADEA93A|nr:hypothetical protein [Burkholderia ubonensis]